jgi:hypothetical protein
MADVHFVFYEKATGTAGRRPAVLSVIMDEAAAPDYVVLGLDTLIFDHVRLTVFDPNALSSGQTVTVNSLATLPSTAADYEVGGVVTDLDAGLSTALAGIDALIASATSASAPTQKITLAQWAAHQAYIADLQTARVAILTADVPLDVDLPALSLPAGTSTKTVAQQIAALMDDSTVDINKQRIFNRNTLLPEFGFDEKDLKFFSTFTGGGAISFDTSANKSGGACMVMTKTVAGLAISAQGLQINYTSVRENAAFGWAWEFRRGGTGTLTAGYLQLDVVWFDEAGNELAVTPTTRLHRVMWYELDYTWASKEGQVISPVGARFATLRITTSSDFAATGGTPSGVFDSCQLRPSISTEHVAEHALTPGKLAGVRSYLDTFSQDWDQAAGNGYVFYSVDPAFARVGGRSMTMRRGNQPPIFSGPNVNPNTQMVSKDKFPYNPYKVYQIKFRVRRVSASGTTPGNMFLGVIAYKADKKTKMNALNLGDTFSSAFYVAANGVVQSGIDNNSVTEYVGYIGGSLAAGATSGTGNTAPDPLNPRALPFETAYFAPTIISNNGVVDQTGTEMNYNAVEVTELPDILAPCQAILSKQDLGWAQNVGAGDAQTQATSKTTSVTLNKETGAITTAASALAAGASATFQVNCSFCTSLHMPYAVGRGAGNYRIEALTPGAGFFFIRITNVSGGSLSEAIVINFGLLQGAQN